MDSLSIGFILAFLLAALPGKPVIKVLQKLGAKQTVSLDAPEAHLIKQGTPTMGGLLIICSLTITVLVYFIRVQLGENRHPEQDFMVLPALGLTIVFGAIGFVDDLLSARRGKNLGFRAREKLLAQFVAAILYVLWLAKTAQPGLTTSVEILPALNFAGPLFDGRVVDFGFWYYPLAVLFIVGFSNATNFTDGLDGLSSGVIIIVSLALATLLGQSLYPSLGFFGVAMAGALAGFLWWNAHPAKIFMGDTGSLALGAGLAGIALLGKQEVGLFVASLVCWIELFSVIVQVGVFKFRKRKHGIENARAHRVFRRTPIHHHFEELGWAETLVVQRFWLAGGLFGAIAMLWYRG